ncbi:MAG: hypothetical protein LLG97_01905 [Deltaproteobacteria bacterium]|nr:hypothetical protein [Deltaproteobacteria bacterium]
MLRVVDVLPGREEIKSSGLTVKDFRIDPDAYGHFVDQYHRDYLAFERGCADGGPTTAASADRESAGRRSAPEATSIDAFDHSRPPYHYHKGIIYRYRIDPAGPAERPIILESVERSEITGSLLGVPFTSHHRSLLMRLCLWIGEWLGARAEKS